MFFVDKSWKTFCKHFKRRFQLAHLRYLDIFSIGNMSQMAENPRCTPNVCCIYFLTFTLNLFCKSEGYTYSIQIWYLCEYLKVHSIFVKGLLAKTSWGLAQALICCVTASYCPWRMCNRNGHCWNHKWVNGKIWKIAFLKLDAAVIFWLVCGELKGACMDLRVMYILIYIYTCIYLYMHNTYQICIYIYMWWSHPNIF